MDQRTVHIIDDNPAELEALNWLLTKYGYAVNAWKTAGTFLSTFDPHKPAVIMTDVNMPEIDGLKCLEILQQRACPAPVVMMTGVGTVTTAVQAVKLGAVDFIEKPYNHQTILDIAHNAYDIALERYAAAKRARERDHRLSALTAREMEIYNHLILGKTNKAISAELGITLRTVEVHRANIMKKTGAHSLTDLIQISL